MAKFAIQRNIPVISDRIGKFDPVDANALAPNDIVYKAVDFDGRGDITHKGHIIRGWFMKRMKFIRRTKNYLFFFEYNHRTECWNGTGKRIHKNNFAGWSFSMPGARNRAIATLSVAQDELILQLNYITSRGRELKGAEWRQVK